MPNPTVYFVPIWFQAIKDTTAVESGVRLLPLVLSMVIASIVNGVLVSKVGYYTPFMIFGNCVMAVGAGLLTTLQVDTEQPKWIGYEFLYGWGIGSTFQAPNIAAQTAVSQHDTPVAVSLMLFGQLLGGAIFISVGQNVLNNELVKSLSTIPGFNPSVLLNSGATTLIHQLPPELLGPVLEKYNDSLRKVFQVGLIMACLVILGALRMEWLSVKKNLPGKKEKDAEAAVEAVGGAATPEQAAQEAAENDTDVQKHPETEREKESEKEKEKKEEKEKPMAAIGNGKVTHVEPAHAEGSAEGRKPPGTDSAANGAADKETKR